MNLFFALYNIYKLNTSGREGSGFKSRGAIIWVDNAFVSVLQRQTFGLFDPGREGLPLLQGAALLIKLYYPSSFSSCW